jgi:hypothetical protein
MKRRGQDNGDWEFRGSSLSDIERFRRLAKPAVLLNGRPRSDCRREVTSELGVNAI